MSTRTSRSTSPKSAASKTAAKAASQADAALGQRLDAARRHCEAHGAQLTEQRREVLELLLRRAGHAKAYDIQEDMQARHGRVAPTTVYRALDFLIEQQLVHKVDTTNSYVVCEHGHHDEHPTMMLICSRCGSIQEWQAPGWFEGLKAALKADASAFAPAAIEIKGRCSACG